MNIRSVTCFVNVDETLDTPLLDRAGALAKHARTRAAEHGLRVQSTRLAPPPLHTFLRHIPALEFSVAFERTYRQLGFDYAALLVADPLLYPHATALVGETASLFISLEIATHATGIDFDAIRAAARTIKALASVQGGLGNFRFAASANIPPGVPYFPTAYASAAENGSFAFAMEAADLAVDAFTGANDLEDARARLIDAVETRASQLQTLGAQLESDSGFAFAGIDFSLAPFPVEGTSLATALERLTGARFGTRGTLFGSAFVTDCLKRARFQRAGFSTLMLPMLEDWTMARRSQEHLFSLDSLLLYSTVCGTGLDTIPLAGDVTEPEIAALLLDLAALATKLDKPLTARLVPVPGVRADATTQFNFEYFANAAAFAINADPAMNALTRASRITFK